MKNGEFIWFCGEYLVLVRIATNAKLTEDKDDYALELQRDALVLSFGSVSIPLDDEQVSLRRLNDGMQLSQVTKLSDYGEIDLPIEAFSGVKELLSQPYGLLSVKVS